ncbi:hypothetical protein [Paenibacillus alkalitolerans]|uniref:hypothetical protein n=1 Tax=Paenibacillus alkalitolerans TaxID=2799335 RepID=UPI0018F5CFF5|nr:hypothetical protein [Paenibacillus alkalitolerans]
MDDVIELLIRIIEPIIRYLGPHAVAASAIVTGVVTFYFQKKRSLKQRIKERRMEAKMDAELENQRLIMAHLGVKGWVAPNSISYSQVSVTKSKSPFISHLGAFIIVLFARLNILFRTLGNNLRRNNFMKNKFKSRKFWMAVITAVLIVLNDGLELGIDNETVLTFAGLVATYILGETAVDATRAKNNNDDFSH